MDPLGKVVLPFVPAEFMERYGYNMYAQAYRKPIRTDYRGRCAICREVGVLWIDLKFYWFEFPRNFLCHQCHDTMPDDEKNRRWTEGQIWRLRMYERRQARNKAGIRRKGP